MVASPGYASQPTIRTMFRILGIVIAGVAITFIVIAARDLFAAGDSFDDAPTKFWMFFVGIPLLAVGGWCLQAGFAGVAARYVAGEAMPVIKDSAAYLSDGEGVHGVGRTVDDAPSKFCSSCGRAAGVDARFCESCGHAFD
jgi:hypothetical protein